MIFFHARLETILVVCSFLRLSMCDQDGDEKNKYPFVPAPPGQRPACAKPGATYCEHVDNYPIDAVTSVLREILGENFNASSVSVDEREGLQEPPEELIGGPPQSKDRPTRSVGLESEFSDKFQDQGASSCCQGNTIVPKVALNNKKQWRFIATHIPTKQGIVEQKISIIPCQRECQECPKKFVARSLVSLNPMGRFVLDKFLIPFCCSCFS
ncbi:uncharacterized protein LOC106457293 [Limulus polyphemus]|uniref:Uncharacterized protein LOC106457293 n=1 Tax=Limulus polyphemus TaxID=6850 RepID=A0ABM1B092_LIMPO|nr:uncharacterized protein LOC106457293 [Limulus polyphemus]